LSAEALSAAAMSAQAAPAATTPLDVAFRVTGPLGNMVHREAKAGMQFQVALRDLAYDGQVTRAVLEQSQADQLVLWLAVRNMTLTVGRIDIGGQIGQAACGPMEVVVANRREQWIGFELERLEQDGRATLSVRGARFELPNDNWHIGSPAWVRTQGAFLSQQMVVDGLRQGLAQQRLVLQQRLIQAAPMLLTHLCRSANDPAGPQRKIVEAIRSRLLPETVPTEATASAPAGVVPTRTASTRTASAAPAITAIPTAPAGTVPRGADIRRPRPRPLDPATVSR
jgi:hypothetical protein